MKILLVHHELPYPLRSGWDKLTYNLIHALQTVHEVTLIAPVEENTSQSSLQHVCELCQKVITVPVPPKAMATRRTKRWALTRSLRAILGRIPGKVSQSYLPDLSAEVKRNADSGEYDIVQATSILTFCYLRSVRGRAIRVLGPLDDGVESARTSWQVEKRLRKKLGAWVDFRASLDYEPKAYRDVDWLLFYTATDLARVNRLMGELPYNRHCPVASEVEHSYSSVSASKGIIEEPNSLIFVGGLAPYFNRDAVLYFCRDIFPIILTRISSARFYIVGHNPPKHIKDLERRGNIVVTGGVPYEAVPDYLSRTAVYVAPIRAGTGLKTKMIEALRLGKAIVATSTAVAGLWDLGEDVFQIHDDPESFARAVIELLKNAERRQQLGMYARQLYERSYSFDAVKPRLLAVYDEIEKSCFTALS